MVLKTPCRVRVTWGLTAALAATWPPALLIVAEDAQGGLDIGVHELGINQQRGSNDGACILNRVSVEWNGHQGHCARLILSLAVALTVLCDGGEMAFSSPTGNLRYELS